ncbi:MAG: hypothetical protein R2824_23550 [Saprospiraceae bacterium]|nr:hypothetical protein [Lewinella sp.]
MDRLYTSWKNLCRHYTGDEASIQSYWQEIQSAYGGKGRHYHNLQHVNDLLEQANAYRSQLQDHNTLCFSIFYHDIIYKSLRKDNELKSAQVASERLKALGLPDENIQKCVRQIEATQGHQLPERNTDPDLLWFLDFDLSILGNKWERYLNYAQAIRQEYRLYPGWMYRKGRNKALRHFLDRTRLFFTDEYFRKFEAKARENLKRELRLE